jgi:hypothetical protein
MIAAIRLPADELLSYRLAPPEAAVRLFNRKLRRRVLRCLPLVGKKGAIYLEEQRPV